MKYILLKAGPYTSLPFLLGVSHLSQGQHLSYSPSPTHLLMDQLKDVASHSGLLAQEIGFHLLCHLHRSEGLLKESLQCHNSRECD